MLLFEISGMTVRRGILSACKAPHTVTPSGAKYLCDVRDSSASPQNDRRGRRRIERSEISFF